MEICKQCIIKDMTFVIIYNTSKFEDLTADYPYALGLILKPV